MRSRRWVEHPAFNRNTPVRTRIGLSPNHPSFRVGVLRTHLLTALLAQAATRAGTAARIFVRWDDTDAGRANHTYEAGLLEELRHIARIPLADGGLRQSCGAPRYRNALERLRRHGVIAEHSGIPCLDLAAADRTLRLTGTDPRIATSEVAVNTSVPLDASESKVPLLRADGSALWHLASVVDDIDQQTNLIVRGSDKASATAIQVRLFGLLGADPPAFVFVPKLLDRASTRVASLIDQGIRPSALRWYLAEPFLSQESKSPPLTFDELVERLRSRLPARVDSRFDGQRLAALDRKISGVITPEGAAEELSWAEATRDPRIRTWVAAHYRRSLPQQLRLCRLLDRPIIRHGAVPANAAAALTWLEEQMAGGAASAAPPALAWVLTGDPDVPGLSREIIRLPSDLLQARVFGARQAVRRDSAVSKR